MVCGAHNARANGFQGDCKNGQTNLARIEAMKYGAVIIQIRQFLNLESLKITKYIFCKASRKVEEIFLIQANEIFLF